MVKLKAAKSKRKSSKQRHKIERKKREHKRDLRKAAKALKSKGLGPHRSKKSREMAQLAMKVSNTHSGKEEILRQVLKAREDARVEKADRRKGSFTEEGVESNTTFRSSSHRQLLFIPVKQSYNFKEQFISVLHNLVFPEREEGGTYLEVPSAAYVVTLDSRFSVQCVPWTLLDSIVDRSSTWTGTRKILVLFTLTKMDLVSTAALVTQMSLLANAIRQRYGDKGMGTNIVCGIVPFSIHHDRTCGHLLRVLNQFRQSNNCCSANCKSNLDGKICAFVIGLPNTGRRSMCRRLGCEANDTSVSSVPVKSIQLQLIKQGTCEEDQSVTVKLAFPNAKAITLVQFAEDSVVQKELRTITGGDIMFRSPVFIEKVLEPESIGCVLFGGVLDKRALAQAFCQSAVLFETSNEKEELNAAEKFLRDLGRTVRRDKGFHVSPLFVSNSGTMGRTSSSSLTANTTFTSGQQSSQSTLLDASYSNATPSKLIRTSSVVAVLRGARKAPSVKRADSHNTLRLGARTFIRELSLGKNVPWAVMRAPGMAVVTPQQIATASEVFDLAISGGNKLGSVVAGSAIEHLSGLVAAFAAVLKDFLSFLPNAVVEMEPDCIIPPQYILEASDEEVVLPEEDGGEEFDEEEGGGS